MWCSHAIFLEVFRECWELPVTSCTMVRLSQKLKKLKCVLSKWNIEAFGRVGKQLKSLEENLNDFKQSVIHHFTEEAERELLLCKQTHLDILHRQEIMGCQNSRVKWLKEGDSNTIFFYASMKCKQKNKMIEYMKLEDGRHLSFAEEVQLSTVTYFKDLLLTSAITIDEDVMSSSAYHFR